MLPKYSIFRSSAIDQSITNRGQLYTRLMNVLNRVVEWECFWKCRNVWSCYLFNADRHIRFYSKI